MRYKFRELRGTIMRRNGTIAYQAENGVLVVGNPTLDTGVNIIDFAANSDNPELEIMMRFATDLDGATTDRAEMAGQGDLTAAAPTDRLPHFYQAPPITPGATTVSEGLWYEVLSSTVTYDGVDYEIGDEFQGVADVTTTSGTGTFALTIPTIDCAYDRAAEYKKKVMMTGNEAIGYGGIEGGFTPMTSNSYTDADFYGAVNHN